MPVCSGKLSEFGEAMYNGVFQSNPKGIGWKKWLLIGGAALLTLALIGCLIYFNLRPEPPAVPAAQVSATTTPGTTQPATSVPPKTETEATTQPTTATDSSTTTTSPDQQTEPTTGGQESDTPTPPQPYKLTCSKYFVYDVTAGSYLAQSGDASTRIYPASITKLFTIHVALQHLTPDTMVTVGSEITMIHPDSTVASLRQGDVVSVDLLVGGMLLPSGNDAAYALAAAAGREILNDPNCSANTAVNGFVEEMNRQAQALGMTGSHFANPDGIHRDDHYFSMADMVKLGRLSLDNPRVMKYAGTAIKTVQLGDRYVTWKNTNLLVRSDLLSMEPTDSGIDPERLAALYNEHAIGLKTGRTTPAGYCLLSAFRVEGRVLLVGVFGASDSVPRCEDALYLFNKAIEPKTAEAQ